VVKIKGNLIERQIEKDGKFYTYSFIVIPHLTQLKNEALKRGLISSGWWKAYWFGFHNALKMLECD